MIDSSNRQVQGLSWLRCAQNTCTRTPLDVGRMCVETNSKFRQRRQIFDALIGSEQACRNVQKIGRTFDDSYSQPPTTTLSTPIISFLISPFSLALTLFCRIRTSYEIYLRFRCPHYPSGLIQEHGWSWLAKCYGGTPRSAISSNNWHLLKCAMVAAWTSFGNADLIMASPQT